MPIANGAYTRTNSFGGDGAKMFPQFFSREVQDQLASAREGRPIFRNEERVTIIIPGNPLTRPEMRVTDEQRERWPKEYEAYKKGEEFTHEGTSLKNWPVLNRAMVAEFNALQIHTIEQLAELSDTAVQRIGLGGRRAREMAQAYLDDAKANALTSRLDQENEALRSQLAAQALQIEEQGKLLSQLSARIIAAADAPNAIQTAIPGNTDPFEMAKRGADAPSSSALDAFDASPRRGRPRKAA